MNPLLEIEFKGRRKDYAANPLLFPFQVGDAAIIDVDRGHDLGKISHIGPRPGVEAPASIELRALRKATTADLRILAQNREREVDARQACRRKARDHNLDMKIVDVELQWDGRKMTVYFTAEGRVDFRELVKDLATSFRTRIDLRQIGARDETKHLSGYGICGRPLCCSTFLSEFKPITTQMPRDQFLPLNPSKLSGVCGRLKCCLRYELDVYREFQRNCPKIGQPIKDELKGPGNIDKLDLIREQISVRWGTGEVDKYTPQEFVQLTNWRPEMPKNECICTCGKRPVSTPPPAPAKKGPVSQIEEAPQSVEGAEKVTLIAGGGLGLTSQQGEHVRFGQSADLEAKLSESKKKRRRKRRKKKAPGAPGASTSPTANAPDDGDADDAGEDEE